MNNNIEKINDTSKTTKQVQQDLQTMANDLKTKTQDLNLDSKTLEDINTLAQKIDTYAKQERDIKVSLKSSDLYDITGAVKKDLTNNLEKATEDVVKETNDFRVKSQNEIKQATDELISYSRKLKDETEKYKKWYVSAMIGFVAFAVVLLMFTMLADMPFLEHAYQFIATKIQNSKTWYVTVLWYLAYLITPMFWVGFVTGVAYLLHRWYTD
ncbi:DUF334 domain-containing protein [Staphylococcus haemolyticus]|nr:DUF334 domain-containing protein [Staphylococcus haemolyticus]MCH4414060.1 DUF334 domain-containing protein [Staphylococcus haemolyticus]